MNVSSRPNNPRISVDISVCSTWVPIDADDDDYIPYGGIYSFVKEDEDEDSCDPQAKVDSPQIDVSFDKIPFSSTIPSILLLDNEDYCKRLTKDSFGLKHKSYTVENITDIAEIVPDWQDHFEELEEIVVISRKSTTSNSDNQRRSGSLSFLPNHARFEGCPSSTPKLRCPKSRSMPTISPKSPTKLTHPPPESVAHEQLVTPPTLTAAEVLRIAGQIINLVHSLHSKNIVHGALCPATIATHLGDPGQLVLGVLNSVSEINSSSPERWTWFAPEIILGWTFDESVDVWGFGALLFWLVFREHPFAIRMEEDELEMERLILHGPVQFPPDCEDSDLRSLIQSCLERNPIARPKVHQVIGHEYFQNEDMTFQVPIPVADAKPTSAQRIVDHYRDSILNPPEKKQDLHRRSDTIDQSGIVTERPDSPPLQSLGTPLSISAALELIPEEPDAGLTAEQRVTRFWDRVDAEARHQKHEGRRRLRKKQVPTPPRPSLINARKEKPAALPSGLHWSGSGGIGYDCPSSWSMQEIIDRIGCYPSPDIKAGFKKLLQGIRRTTPISSQPPDQPITRPSSDTLWVEPAKIRDIGEGVKVQRVEAWKTIELVRDSDNAKLSPPVPADIETPSTVASSSSGSPEESLFERASSSVPLTMTPGTEYTFSSSSSGGKRLGLV